MVVGQSSRQWYTGPDNQAWRQWVTCSLETGITDDIGPEEGNLLGDNLRESFTPDSKTILRAAGRALACGIWENESSKCCTPLRRIDNCFPRGRALAIGKVLARQLETAKVRWTSWKRMSLT